MAKLLEITGKAISGEWGQDDDTGTGIPVLRTTNFTNEGFVNYKNVVTRSILKKNIAEKYLRHGDVIIEKSGGSDKQPVGRVIFFEGEENKYLFNNFTGLLRVQNPEEWLPKYVFYALYAYYRNGGTRAFATNNLLFTLFIQNNKRIVGQNPANPHFAFLQKNRPVHKHFSQHLQTGQAHHKR